MSGEPKTRKTTQDSMQIWIDRELHAQYKELAPLTRRSLRGIVEVALMKALPEIKEEVRDLMPMSSSLALDIEEELETEDEPEIQEELEMAETS